MERLSIVTLSAKGDFSGLEVVDCGFFAFGDGENLEVRGTGGQAPPKT
jgi:hypothetical protein